MDSGEDVYATFRSLILSADRKFSLIRDLPHRPSPLSDHHYHKAFKSYMRLWKFQQSHRSRLVESGLKRHEIGDIASRIGQLYYGQYLRTSEARFLVEAYVFYEAILNRRYFEGEGRDVGVRFKELRFYARFLVVALVLCKGEMVRVLIERFKAVVEETKEINSKQWKQVVQEIFRFTKAYGSFSNPRPMRYCIKFDTHSESLPYIARFHANKVLKLRDAVLTSYQRNEVKFAELTLDTYRMLQCLEWEPSGSFYQQRPAEVMENGRSAEFSATSGLIDINLAVDLLDPTLPPNPKKAIIYRPTATHFLAVIATVCEELPQDSVMLIYISSRGSTGCTSDTHVESSGGSGGSGRSSKMKSVPHASHDQSSSPETHDSKNGYVGSYDSCVLLGPRGNGGSNVLYPADLIPFTRRPLFLVIDSDTSHAFKADRGEPVALLLSPLRPSFEIPSKVDGPQRGGQFTFFLTAPLQAFCSLVGMPFSDGDMDLYDAAENIISRAFSEWEVILCTSPILNLVWAQVLSDPFLRRLILRFIFCRAVLSLFHNLEDSDGSVPLCVPVLLDSLLPDSEVVASAVLRLAEHMKVSGCFIRR
ncbi:SCAI-like protein [Drosera capensis]